MVEQPISVNTSFAPIFQLGLPNLLLQQQVEEVFSRHGRPEGQVSHRSSQSYVRFAPMEPGMELEHGSLDTEQGPDLQPCLHALEGYNATAHKRQRVWSLLKSSHTSCTGLGNSTSTSGLSVSFHGQGKQGEESSSSQLQNKGNDPMDTDNGYEEGSGDRDGNGEDNGSGEAMAHDMITMDLTDDLLHLVFSSLDQQSLCVSAMVCHQWRTASAHEDFWRSLSFEGGKITEEKVAWLCCKYPKAVELSLRDVPYVDEVAREAMFSLQGLERLNLHKGNLTDSFFNELAHGCLALQELKINDAVLGSGGSQGVLVQHENLRQLQVTKCKVMRIAIRCPLLDKLSLKGTSMASAALQCPILLSLDVSSCHKLSDASVRAAATDCPALLALDISQCSYVSDETLREISIACLNLHTLDASYCPNISLEGVCLPMLKELRLQNCEGINSTSMAALSQCLMLETIRLDVCALLTSVVLDLQRLQNITLANCRKFIDLTLRCPALVDISISTCPVLKRLDISSLALKRLVLQKQVSLTTMSLQCPGLCTVDLSECDSLSNSVCKVFSEGGGCPRLTSLTLDSCESLTVVNISSPSLESLSLAGCRKMYSLKLACVKLQRVYLDGCDHLTTATFAPVGLQYLNLGICPRVTNLKIEALSMTSLDLMGCGALSQANIYCPQLLFLDAFYCSRLEDDCLEATATSCPLIQSLILASCPSIGPAGLSALRKLSHLTVLDLSYTFLTDLTPIFETCPRLKTLRLLACKYLVDTALDSLHGKKMLPELQELDLSYGSLGQAALEGLLRQCSHLTHVNLNGCVNLYDLDWESKPETGNLSMLKGKMKQESMEEPHPLQAKSCTQQLEVKYEESGYRVGSASQSDIVENSKSFCIYGRAVDGGSKYEQNILRKRMVQEQNSFPVHALQYLNCVGCPNIKKVVITDATGFRDLFSLNLSLSSNITQVRIECLYLTSLNLSNCTALEDLDIKCPRLVSLWLQASSLEESILESVLQGCSALETLDIRNCPKISFEALAQVRAACPRLKRLLNSTSANHSRGILYSIFQRPKPSS